MSPVECVLLLDGVAATADNVSKNEWQSWLSLVAVTSRLRSPVSCSLAGFSLAYNTRCRCCGSKLALARLVCLSSLPGEGETV
jgi:hypothetical protein